MTLTLIEGESSMLLKKSIKKTKKAAMFGLDFRALKKQFGELFLARRQSEAPYGANGSSGYTKRAAMFGLDARIALAIFSALTVITGASLSSAVTKAKAEQWRQYFESIVKASEAYYLDTGLQLGLSENATQASYLYLNAEELGTNSKNIKSWGGPYLTLSSANMAAIKNNMTQSIDANSYTAIWLRKLTNWSQMNDVSSDEYCTINDFDCSEWVVLYAGSNNAELQSIFKLLDELVDNNDGELAGKVRYNTEYNDFIMYKGISHIYRG